MSQLNRLSSETSPYLLQHVHNPVNWYPWGDEAFSKAKAEGKLVLISIGYSSCHWCHVMEREAFSDLGIAQYMNDNYVCIKVDREERPDVDQIYMNAIQIITRSGGWPLNCFALPDGRPVFGGTYFPKENWLNVLESLNTTWKNDNQRVVEVAEELSKGISETEIVKYRNNTENSYKEVLQQYIDKLYRVLDFRNGGTKGAPKFPMPGLLDFLLTFSLYKPDKELYEFVISTLTKIANGGINDHIGGGFARYSTDEGWRVPHFEKMLYDNAQLISIYSKAYRITENDTFKKVVYEALGFIETELKSDTGGYFSALDADSNGIEGEYYLWSKKDIERVAGNHSELFCAAYSISAPGNWNGHNILYRTTSSKELECIFGYKPDRIEEILEEIKVKLKKERLNKIRPSLDNKIILAWNALLVQSLVDAYVSFNDPVFLSIAEHNVDYLLKNHVVNTGLKRISCQNKTYIDGMLDDYSYLIKALIGLFKVTHKEEYLSYANTYTKYVIDVFYDENSRMFFYSPYKNGELIVRKMDLTDGVMPSSCSVMIQNLIELNGLNQNNNFADLVSQNLANIVDFLRNGSPYVYNWANQMLTLILPEIKITVGKDFNSKQFMSNIIYPHTKIEITTNPDQSGNYHLCIGNSCNGFIADLDKLVKEVRSIRLD